VAQVVWAQSALNALREIDEYTSSRSPANAAVMVTRLSEAARLLETAPQLGGWVPEFDWDYIRALAS
jgi:hypothetical protein